MTRLRNAKVRPYGQHAYQPIVINPDIEWEFDDNKYPIRFSVYAWLESFE